MNIKYLPENDLMYIYLVTKTPNIQTKTPHPDISKFIAKGDKKQIVGYEIESVTKNIKYVLTKLDLTRKQKLAICLFVIRETNGKTQREFAKMLSVGESTYKNIEKAEHNISFDTLDMILNRLHNEPVMEGVLSGIL